MSGESRSSMYGRALAITGLGIVGAPGAGLDAQRQALIAGSCGLRIHPTSRVPIARTAPVGLVQVPLAPMPGRTAALAMTAARAAVCQAAIPLSIRSQVAVITGTCTGGMAESESVFLQEGINAIDATYAGQHPHRTTQMVAHYFGFGGAQATHAVACASAACAIIDAMEIIRSGESPIALAIGADALTRITSAGFTSLQLVDPLGCRPLTVERGGMSLGEGAACLVIEDAEHARKRGATILASIIGWGMHADGFHLTTPDPAGTQLRRAISDCLRDADIAPAAIGYVNAHGTGTRDNDQCEDAILSSYFGAVPTASSKRTYGHTMGAAAAIEAVACCLALIDQTLWPSAGVDTGTPLSGVEVVRHARPAALDVALSTTLAFGGVNACLAFAGADRCA